MTDSVWIVEGMDIGDKSTLYVCESKEYADVFAKLEGQKGNGWSAIFVREYQLSTPRYCIECLDSPLCAYEYMECAKCLEGRLND